MWENLKRTEKTETLCMHTLRRIYAACAIERDMRSKALQQLLGHVIIKMPMDRYDPVTDESLVKAVPSSRAIFASLKKA